MTPALSKRNFKDEVVSAGEQPSNDSNTVAKLPDATSDDAERNNSEAPVNSRSNDGADGSKFDANKAFKEATKLIKRGVLTPSRFAIERWILNEFGVKPKRVEIEAWQGQLQTKGIIEPCTVANGKSSYRLKVTPPKEQS